MPYFAANRKYKPPVLMNGPGLVRMPVIMLGRLPAGRHGIHGMGDDSVDLTDLPISVPSDLGLNISPDLSPAFTSAGPSLTQLGLEPTGGSGYYDPTTGTFYDANGVPIAGQPSLGVNPGTYISPTGTDTVPNETGINAQGLPVNSKGQVLTQSGSVASAAQIAQLATVAVTAGTQIAQLSAAQRASAPPGAVGINSSGQYVNALGQPINSLGQPVATLTSTLTAYAPYLIIGVIAVVALRAIGKR
jgi:hypothetical protein